MNSHRLPLSRIGLFLLLVVIGCGLDLGTKSWIFGRLGITPPKIMGDPDPIVIVPGIFGLTTNLNEGALFGLGQGGTLVFAGLSVLAAIGISYWMFFGGAGKDIWLTVALGGILAGILGNLYDRLGLPGLVWPAWPQWPASLARAGQPVYAVRDWIHFQIERVGFDWAVFNIADSMLVVGAGMLFWHVAWRERKIAAKPIAKCLAA